MLSDVFEQSRWTCGEIGRDIHSIDLKTFFVCLQYGIYHIAKFGSDIERHQTISTICTKTAHRIRHHLTRERPYHKISKSLKLLFVSFKMIYLGRVSIAYHNISLACYDRLHEF